MIIKREDLKNTSELRLRGDKAAFFFFPRRACVYFTSNTHKGRYTPTHFMLTNYCCSHRTRRCPPRRLACYWRGEGQRLTAIWRGEGAKKKKENKRWRKNLNGTNRWKGKRRCTSLTKLRYTPFLEALVFKKENTWPANPSSIFSLLKHGELLWHWRASYLRAGGKSQSVKVMDH